MEIRELKKQEIQDAVKLIWETFLEYEGPDYSQQGIDHFHEFISDEKLAENVEFFGAFDEGIMKGVIATRNERSHICCFFVKGQFHNQGIGRQLWEYLRDNSPHSSYTVNSSPYALEVYRRLGFKDTDSEQLSSGIRYIPMKYDKGYPNPLGAKVQTLIYDCPDPGELAEFYARLLGGAVEEDPYGGHSVVIQGLGIDIAFQEDEFYERPVWLGEVKDQQPMVHIDIHVDDREEAIKYALSLGAELPEKQFCEPDWGVQWTTMLDPAGHPFCFFDDKDE